MAINQNVLLKEATEYSVYVLSESFTKKSEERKKADKTAFLCYSHHDEALAKGLLVRFAKENIALSIDFQYSDLNIQADIRTIKTIKSKINEASYFLFLATAHSKESVWCPWEIGYADASKKSILVIASRDGRGTYGNEYLKLYSNIDISNLDHLCRFEIGKTTGTRLNAIF